MTKDEIVKKQKQYIFPSVFTYYSDPLVTDRASMQHLWDVEGNKYLDFFGGIVTISVGHANPRVTGKIKAQVDRLQHASSVFPNEAVAPKMFDTIHEYLGLVNYYWRLHFSNN